MERQRDFSLISYFLVVDLDGTLIHTNVLHESALQFFKHDPLRTFKLIFFLLKSKASLKQNLAISTDFDPSMISYNDELLDWLEQPKAASKGTIKLSGEHTEQKLELKYGWNG